MSNELRVLIGQPGALSQYLTYIEVTLYPHWLNIANRKVINPQDWEMRGDTGTNSLCQAAQGARQFRLFTRFDVLQIVRNNGLMIKRNR